MMACKEMELDQQLEIYAKARAELVMTIGGGQDSLLLITPEGQIKHKEMCDRLTGTMRDAKEAIIRLLSGPKSSAKQ